jgi:DNA polymerase (family 10)
MVTYKSIINYFKNKANKILKENNTTSKFRALNYRRVINIIENKCPDINQNISCKFINELPITNYMKKQILDYEKNKNEDSLKNADSVKNADSIKNIGIQDKLYNDLKGILGIGSEKAKKLILEGVKDIKDLHYKKWFEKLPNETKIFLSKIPEKPIPYNNIKVIEKLIKKIKIKMEFVGSYRRKKSFSNDIDIMLISDNENILDEFLNKLNKLTKNKTYPYSKGSDKMSIIIDTENITPEKHIYKLDIFRCPKDIYIPMLLYSTGSKEFNIFMRSIAKRKGYLLNQNGLFRKNNGEKITGLNTEKDYFDLLGILYKNPEDRI